MESHRDLLLEIETLMGDEDNDAALGRILLRHKHSFLGLLQYKANNAESRQQVQSRRPVTYSRGEIQLDEDPDVKLALLLSDELKLDEVYCVELLLSAHEERGDLSAEMAAGVFFEERRGLLASLHRLLQYQALLLDDLSSADAMEERVSSAISEFNGDLLSARNSAGQSVLIARLVELIKDVVLEAGAGSNLASVRDKTGDLVPRNALLQREKTLLCECLLYAMLISKTGSGLNAPTISVVAELMHFQALKLANLQSVLGGSAASEQKGDLYTMLHHTVMVTGALLVGLSPSMEPLSSQQDGQQATLSSVATSPEVSNALRLSETTGFHRIGALAFGLLQQQCSADKAAAQQNVRNSLAGGVLRFLVESVLESVPLQDDLPQQQELISRIVMDLVLRLLTLERDLVYQQLIPGKAVQATSIQAHASNAAVDANAKNGDDIATLLSLLASIFHLRPELILDDRLRDDSLTEFLESVPFGACMHVPEVLISYLRVLKSVCTGEVGARMVFNQLMHPHMPEQLSWSKLFYVMLRYCHQFQPQEIDGDDSNSRDHYMSEGDANGLVAYLDLFCKMLTEGNVQEVTNWIRQLEDKVSLRPLYEVLVQLMCHRVPHDLKAALMRTIAAFAINSDASAELWERIKLTAIFEPSVKELGNAGSMASLAMRYDLTYQLAEIEERAEKYPEVRAFIALLNALWKASATSEVPNSGRSYSHFTRFVREVILGQLSARAYKVPREKWELADVAFQHLLIVLRATVSSRDLQSAVAMDSSGVRAPGADVMLDMLQEARSMRAVMGVAMTGVDELIRARVGSEHGIALEGAVLSALQLLVCALEAESTMVPALLAVRTVDRDTSVLSVLKADARRLAVLSDYVSYPHSIAIQIEALRLTKVLVERLPNLVDFLARGMSPRNLRLDELQFTRAVRSATALEASLFRTPEGPTSPDDADTLCVEDPRAQLILQIMLSTVELPGPNMAQLLLGFPLDSDSHVLPPDPHRNYTCLTVVLQAATSRSLPHQRPRLYEQVLELLHLLAASEQTRTGTLAVLRSPPWCMLIGPQLDNVLCAPLPESAPARIASLHARSWMLQLFALELHVSDPVLYAHAESAQLILGELFDPNATRNVSAIDNLDGFTALEQRRARILEVLELIIYPLTEPHNMAEGEVRRMLEEMQLQELLMSSVAIAEGGVRTTSERGCSVIDVPAFIAKVMERYTRIAGMYSSSTGSSAADEALKAAAREAVSLAHGMNVFQEESMAQFSLLASWQELVEVVYSRRYALLGAALQSSRAPTELQSQGALVVYGEGGDANGGLANASESLYEVLRAGLDAMETVLLSGMDRLAPLLCSAVLTLLSRLMEAGSSVGYESGKDTASMLQTLWLPSRCHEILLQLLKLLKQGRRNEGVRCSLYGSLLAYIQMCKGPRAREWPTAVLDVMLGGSDYANGVASIDARQAELEEGNSLQLQGYAPMLIEMLGMDGLCGRENSRALVFQLLSALVSADPLMAHEVHRTDLPRNVLDSLPKAMAAALSLPSRQSQSACIVIEAQLGLLQGLCLVGLPHHRSAGAQRVFSIGALRCLASCRALGMQVEELGAGAARRAMSLRSRLGRMLRGALRLLSCLTAALSTSANVTSEALEVVEVHAKMLGRVLSEVSRGGDLELEQGFLVAGCLARLAPALVAAPPPLRYKAQQLDARMWHLASIFLPLDEETKQESCQVFNPLVAAICKAKDQMEELLEQRESAGVMERKRIGVQIQNLSTQLEQSQHHCRGLRCYLLRYIHKVVMYIRAGGDWSLPEDGDTDMCGSEEGPYGPTYSQAVAFPAAPSRVMLLVQCLHQAVLDLHDAVSDRLRLLDLLRSGAREQMEECAHPTGSLVEQTNKCSAAGAVANTERTIKQVLYICELTVAMVLGEAEKRVLSRSDADMRLVARRIKRPFELLGHIKPDYLPTQADSNHLTLLIRRAKDYLSSYD